MSEDNVAAGQQQLFEIQKIYLKDISLETPDSPMIFTEKWQPEINLQINSASKPIDDGLYEVVLTLTVTAKLDEKTAYLIEAQQAGVFAITGVADKQRLEALLGAFCPNILFPYAREAVDSLVIKGGFPSLPLKPVNFEALYHQHLQAQKEKAQTKTEH